MASDPDPTLRETLSAYGRLLRENLIFVILALGVIAALVVAASWRKSLSTETIAEETGEVVRIGHPEDKGAAGLLVTVRTGGGQVQGVMAGPDALAGCRPGGRIRLVRRGGVLSVAPRGCDR